MRTLIAFDKFKDALTAPEACARAAEALRAVRPEWSLDLCPLTDGGEGFAEILTQAAGGTLHRVRVTGPRGEPVDAHYGLVDGARVPAAAWRLLDLPATAKVAVIEMAQASGLALLPSAARDPWLTSSIGTGEVIRQAMAHGAGAVLLGVGGSATNDLGLGALSALGFSFRSAQGALLNPPVPRDWSTLASIEGRALANLPPIRIACDVVNPLLGPQGATAIYGPQKGLKAHDAAALEILCEKLADLLCNHSQQPASLRLVPGAGAAGGCSFGLMAGTGARLLPGSAFVSAWLDVDRRLAAADLVITGEGRFDESSLSGKGPGAIAAQALGQGRTVHVFAGAVNVPDRPGLHAHAISPPGLPLAQALSESGWRLETAVRAILGKAG